MSDLNAGINAEMVAHLRGQAEAHLTIATALEKRSRPRNTARAYTALQRASVHAEFAHRYAALADHITSGRIDWADIQAPGLVMI